jgi:hypothetical protein
VVKQESYSCIGTPARVVPLQELAGMLSRSPFLRDAVNRINRFEGCPRKAEVVIHEDYRKHVNTVKNNAFQVNQAIRKQKGIIA